MGDVIRFPARLPSLELEEVFDFGAVGSVMVSLVRESGNDNAPLTLALSSENALWGLHGVMTFKPEDRALAEIVGTAVVKALEVARSSPDLGTANPRVV